MSTLPGVASKGEKGKSKYQSLDINNLYKVYTTEPSEAQQPKNTLPRKHGMQSLGKVPTARRPPANLPSLKSEHTGSDAAVSLVPSGGPGWGKQEPHSPSSTTPPSTSVPNSNTTSPSTTNVPPNAQPVIAVPVPPIPPPVKHHLAPTATPVTADKSWSSIMSGTDIFQPPPYQSPQFQHEFPSLSAGDGVPPRIGIDTQYGPGPSLRPQTEGSWIQGGVRPGSETSPKGNSGPLAPPPQLSAQGGHINQQQQQPLPPQFRGVMPPFMYRGNFAQNGPAGPNFPGSMNNGRNPAMDNRGGPRGQNEGMCHRPIIKEEELNRMDDMARDSGWATHDDIDYNQKLAFSDDEGDGSKNKKTPQQRGHDKTELNSHEVMNNNNWSNKSGSNTPSTASQGNKNRSNEEDEVWIQRRRQQSEEVAIAVERAKQRKEEEEKRFLETKQAAAKKLQKLEEKLNKCKIDKETDDSQGTINPSVVPPQPITPVPIPVPDWEKEKEVRSRPLGPEISNNKPQYRESSDFRKLAQIEARSFVRKETRSSERDGRDREQTGPSFSKQFQSNLPPRFLKQQQLRSNTASTPQSPPTSNSNVPVGEHYENHWQQNQAFNKNSSLHKKRPEMEEHEAQQENEFKDSKSDSDDNHKGSHHNYSETNKLDTQYEESREYNNEDFSVVKKDKKEDKWDRDVKHEQKPSKQAVFDDHRISYHGNERDKGDEKFQDRYDRPQRPDSRDSRASRDSRHSRESDSRDYHGSWTDPHYETPYDDRRKDHFREDRRSVPGPITRDRIEADDLKSEKKNLTQLKRGYIPEKRSTDVKKDSQVAEKVTDDGWTIPKTKDLHNESKSNTDVQLLKTNAPDKIKFTDSNEKPKAMGSVKVGEKHDEIDKKDDKNRRPISNRRHADPRQGGWTQGYVYPRTWSKKGDSQRGARNGPPRKSSNKSGESHGTDSDVSAEDISMMHSKKTEKDEKNKEIKQERLTNNDRKMDPNKKDNYLPRGEPSRNGRGAGNFRNRGGLGKRIDGYGPPPSKSPFSQIEDKDKKSLGEDIMPTDNTSSDEKTKQNQQALSAGIIGSNRSGTSKDSSSSQFVEDRSDNKGVKSSSNFENWDTSENSDESGMKEQKTSKFGSSKSSVDRSTNSLRRNPPPRFTNEKRNYNSGMRQNSSGSLKSGSVSGKIIDDGNSKTKSNEETKPVETESVEKVCDSDGFQEVKSKKTGLRQKSCDDKPISKPVVKLDKPIERKKSNGPVPQLTPEQIASLPSLMDTPINPPVIVPNVSNKNQYDRPRQNKLPPRFAKQRENSRLQKVQMHQGMCDINDMNKVNPNLNVYGIKDPQGSVPGRIGNAWEKPLSAHNIRTEQEGMLSIGMEPSKTLEQPQQSASPTNDKIAKSNHVAEKTVLDGATPPVNTIIFENTNFKTTPGTRSSRPDKSSTSDVVVDQTVISTFNKPVPRDIINKNEKPTEPMDMNDMKLDFFESEISHLTDDKGPKNLSLPRSMHAITSVNNTLSASTTDALNFKIASVKRVWENAPTGMEHSVGQEDSNSSFSNSFGTDPSPLDPSGAFGKNLEVPDDGHEVYTASPNQSTANNNTTNVCKVKPTQQITSGGQAVHVPGTHPQHSGVVGPGIVGHPLSPPPIPPIIGGGGGIGQPLQQYTTNQHISYQPNLGGSSQYGMPAIPSPPATLLFNSSPQIQAAQSGLYGAFQLDQAQVLSSQGRTQFSQYPYGLGQTASSPYSAQSMYLQGTQPHPSTGQPPPDLYQNMNSYRLSTTGPYGQGQQLTNPSTVLISSTSNSLMSATVKPTTQQISAIGTKASGAGQAYQQQSQQGQQLYMAYDPTMQGNYLQSTGVMQRQTAPLQNNVVPALQQSSSYYTGSTGGQTSFFQQPASSTLQSPQLSHTGYSLQGNVFGSHSQSHAGAGLQNYNSHYISNPMHLAAALSAQQYRSNSLQNSPYIKNVNIGDGTRPQQIKSPGSQHDVLSSVFNSGPQIPSSKNRQNMKQPIQQPNPTTQLKYNLYQSVGNQSHQAPRFPAPIQRPISNLTYQPAMGSMQCNSGSANPKHRSAGQNKLGGRNYYGGQGNNLSSAQNDKGEDSKLGDTVTANSSNTPVVTNTTSIVTKAIITTNSTITVNQTTEIKETSTKDETSIIKE